MPTPKTLLLVHLCWLFQPASAAVGDVLWKDDFDGGSLNNNYWSYDLGGGGWGNSELQTYTTGAVSVSGGLLNIRADRTSNGFTSGRIKSDGKVTFRYGTLEARIRIPDSDEGLWPAFWTLGENFSEVGWPNSGEIDIMEVGQGLAITEGVVNRRVISGAHWEFEDRLAAYALWKTFNVDLNKDFHTYKLEWTPTSLSTYVDNIKVWEMDIGSANCVDCEEFHQPHFMVLNLAVGGYFTSTGGSGSSGSSSSSGCSSSGSSSSSSGEGCGEPRTDVTAPLPADMQVDWVQILDNGFSEVSPSPEPTPAPTPSVSRVGELSTKAPTRRPTPNPTPSLSAKVPTRRPTPRPTPSPVRVYPTSSSSSRGKGKGKGGSSSASKSGKGKGKGGSSSTSKSGKGKGKGGSKSSKSRSSTGKGGKGKGGSKSSKRSSSKGKSGKGKGGSKSSKRSSGKGKGGSSKGSKRNLHSSVYH
eukprot:scaffold1729_cov117-Cylindrotheca_fusiformis.AAC.13